MVGEIFKVDRVTNPIYSHFKCFHARCDVCGIRCTTKQRLSCHKYNRHQNKLGNYPCPHCDRRFMSIWTMYRHNQEVHGCTQVICRECGQYFETQEQLMTHITNDHPYISHDVSRFSCEDCGKCVGIMKTISINCII